jgi:phosphatidylglycerol---prolipoprotein diacylglyceryl transferase
MHPELIPGWPLHSYGLMLVIGFYAAYFLARRTAKREGVDPKRIVDLLLIGALLGILGSRLFYVVQYRDRIDGLVDAIAIWKGGLVFHGGLITATIGLLIYMKRNKLPVWRVADSVAPAIMLGLALGRVGCFLNGCCWGAVCSESHPMSVRFPRLINSTESGGCRAPAMSREGLVCDGQWHAAVQGGPAWLTSHEAIKKYVVDQNHPEAWREMSVFWYRCDAQNIERITGSYAFLQHLVEHPDKISPDDTASLPVHPTQLYSVVNALAICLILLVWWRWRRRPGEVFALMAVLYGISRFLVEGLRHDTNPVLGTLTMGQVTSVALFVIGLVGFVWCRTRKPELDKTADAA